MKDNEIKDASLGFEESGSVQIKLFLNKREYDSYKKLEKEVKAFLVEHKDFELVEERQFFPFEVYDSCLYSARLKKVEKTSD